MPIYEYECSGCDKVFEVQQRMSEAPLRQCPECEGELRKLVSASSFQLKGGGWYSDGYCGASNGKEKATGTKEVPAASPCKGCTSCPAAAA